MKTPVRDTLVARNLIKPTADNANHIVLHRHSKQESFAAAVASRRHEMNKQAMVVVVKKEGS